MSRLKLILLLLLPLFNTPVVKAAENDNDKLFNSGSLFFLNGNYTKALNNFEVLRNKGLTSSELYCNLGNTCFKLGFPGKALFYYEKGLLLSPLDTQLMHNKNMVNAQLNLPVFDNSISHFVNDVFFLNIINDGILLATLLFVVSGMLFIVLSFGLFRTWESVLRITYKYYLFVSILLSIVLSGVLIRHRSTSYAIVLDKNATAKTGAGELAKNIFILNEGEKIEIENYYEGWYKIKRYNNTEGWISSLKIGLIK